MAGKRKPPSRGRIRSGLKANTLVSQTIDFVYTQLPDWRDDTERTAQTAEEHLNSQLCDFLNATASAQFPMVQFKHEERQTGRRRVDLAVKPKKSINIQSHQFTKYDPFLVMEGKRLPTPGAGRQREYVTGGDERTGGIQRFRLGLHGAEHSTAVMVGYIQSHHAKHWRREINKWIREECNQPADTTCAWSASDLLRNLNADIDAQKSRCFSAHDRAASVTDRIEVHHLWVEM